MTRSTISGLTSVALLATAFVFTGCNKKVAKVTPPAPPPPPAAPTATLAAAPDVFSKASQPH